MVRTPFYVSHVLDIDIDLDLIVAKNFLKKFWVLNSECVRRTDWWSFWARDHNLIPSISFCDVIISINKWLSTHQPPTLPMRTLSVVDLNSVNVWNTVVSSFPLETRACALLTVFFFSFWIFRRRTKDTAWCIFGGQPAANTGMMMLLRIFRYYYVLHVKR